MKTKIQSKMPKKGKTRRLKIRITQTNSTKSFHAIIFPIIKAHNQYW